MCHLSGSNHPSSPTCPTPLIYPSPLLRVSSSFLCRLSSTVPLSSCISVLFLFLALFFPLFCFLFHLNLLYLQSRVFSPPLPPDSLPSHHLACAILKWLQSSQLSHLPRPSYLSFSSSARLFLFPLSLILYCPSFFLYICSISFPCLVLSSLLIPLSFEPAISSFICFLASPLTVSPLITWHVPS